MAPLPRMSTPGRRLKAWLGSLFIDHAFVRLIYLNQHQILPGVWRCAQPLPHQFRAFARRGGKTVINLRGRRNDGSYGLEVEACRKAGLTLINLKLKSRAAPEKAELAAVREVLSTAQTPILFHCKSGADRAGLMAALTLIHLGHRPVEEAAGQLHWRFGHLQHSPAGILDDFFARYLEAHASSGISFDDWVAGPYDRKASQRAFYAARRDRGLGKWLYDRVLRRE